MYSLKSPLNNKGILKKLQSLFSDSSTSILDNDYSGVFKYRDIVGNLSQLVCVKDHKGIYKMANQAFCDLTGLQEVDIVGKDDLELGLFLNPDQIIAADLQVFDSGQKKHIPLEPFTDKYGSLYWFQTNKIPLFDKDENVIQILIISSDITNKIEVEQRLQHSELRYKSIFENNYSGIIVVNSELDILNKNNAFNKLIRGSDDQLGKDDLKKYISKEDKSDLTDLLAGLVTRNYEYFDLPLQLNINDHEVIDTICFVRGLFDEGGKFTEAVVTFQDVTDDLRNRTALEESEKRFRVIVENATEALMLLDYDSRKYIDMNKNAEELFGYSRDELLELTLGDLSPINQSDGSNSKTLSTDYMDQALNGKNVVYEWTIKRKDNKLIPCEVRLVKLPYERNNIVRTSVIDITERKKAERLLNLEKQKLEETNDRLVNLNDKLENQTKQLQEFAYISSHNLRAPAGNIRALLDFYHNEPIEENFKIILEKLDVVSEDLLDTINDLADVVKIKNEISQDVVKLSIAKLLDKVKDSLSQQIRDKKAKISLELNGIKYINASKTYMDSIMLNLISNALKYSKDDVVPIIEVTANQDETNFVLKVADNGTGIDLKKHGDKVFGLRKTFHRNKDSRGVGLFITKAQVEAMDGTIDIQSEIGKGTMFIIKLPKRVIK
ncbi:MAG: hypothetical protein COA58_05370 [Bacteroidetes bacterium]|nr:MAG: hypothetical protein COA58_05370 [Bacteroidota bacterium]